MVRHCRGRIAVALRSHPKALGARNGSCILTQPDRSPTAEARSLNSPGAAFGFDTNLEMGTSFNLVINFTAGPPFGQNYAVPGTFGMTFYGFRSNASDINSVQIQGCGNSTFGFALDNFSFTSEAISTIPEPTSLFLLGTGLSVIGLAACRRKK
jgi:hypothetical protein